MPHPRQPRRGRRPRRPASLPPHSRYTVGAGLCSARHFLVSVILSAAKNLIPRPSRFPPRGIAAAVGTKNMPPACFLNVPTRSGGGIHPRSPVPRAPPPGRKKPGVPHGTPGSFYLIFSRTCRSETVSRPPPARAPPGRRPTPDPCPGPGKSCLSGAQDRFLL